MPSDSHRLARLQREVAEAIRRACLSPHDSIQLRNEIAHHLQRGVPNDACALSTCDPVIGIISHAVAWGYDEQALNEYNAHVYPEETAIRFIDMARNGVAVQGAESEIEHDYLRRHGFADKLNMAFADQTGFWGGGCLCRGRGARSFSEADRALIAHVAPSVAMGLRRAALLEATQAVNVEESSEMSTLPGVAVYDSQSRLVLRDERTASYLDDLTDAPTGSRIRCDVPPIIGAALAQLRWQLRSDDGTVMRAADDGVRGRGKSGRWYGVYASLAEAADPTQVGQQVVVITPLNAAERATLLFRLYGLSPREREVIVHTARGESCKQIALRLGLSMHTVQTHIDNACAKVGARGRKELIARLFCDVAAARVAS